jgi:hypothetical protein
VLRHQAHPNAIDLYFNHRFLLTGAIPNQDYTRAMRVGK